MLGIGTTILLLGALSAIPLLYRMYNRGTINVEKPEKRTYIFEDENGERYNPFEHPDDENAAREEDWKYAFD